MNWLSRTNWPEELKEFIAEIGCDPLAANITGKEFGDSKRIGQLARQYATLTGQSAFSSALYLSANELEASHELSQSIHTGTGSYLHGIMHRREKDFSNANYWFHRATSVDVSGIIESDLDGETMSWILRRGSTTPWRFDPIELTKWHQMAIDSSFGSEADNQTACKAINDLAWQEWRYIFDTLIVSDK